MAGQGDWGGSGTPHRGYFTGRGDTSRLTSPSGTVILGSGPPTTGGQSGQTIQIVMPPGGGNQGQGSGLRISVSSGPGESGGGGTIIMSHGNSVTFNTLPRRVAHTHGGGVVTGGEEGRRVRRMHSSDDMAASVGRVTFSTPQIEEHIYSPTACGSPGVETSRVTCSSPVHEDTVYHARMPSARAQDVKQVFVHKIHLVPALSRRQRMTAVEDTERASPTASGCGVTVTSSVAVSAAVSAAPSAAVGVAGPVHESVCHVPLSHSTWPGVTGGSDRTQSTPRVYLVSSTNTKTHAHPQQQTWRDKDRLEHFDDTVTSNMRRFMLRDNPSEGVGYITPPVTPSVPQTLPTVRKLPLITITHRRKASVDQPGDGSADTPLTPDDKRDLFRKFKFRFGSIGEFAGSGGSGSSGSSSSGSGGSSHARSGRPEVFYFQDFDDLASRIRVLWSKRQETPAPGECPTSCLPSSCHLCLLCNCRPLF